MRSESGSAVTRRVAARRGLDPWSVLIRVGSALCRPVGRNLGRIGSSGMAGGAAEGVALALLPGVELGSYGGWHTTAWAGLLAGGQARVPPWSHPVSDRIPGSSRDSRDGASGKVPPDGSGSRHVAPGPCRPEGGRLARAIPRRAWVVATLRGPGRPLRRRPASRGNGNGNDMYGACPLPARAVRRASASAPSRPLRARQPLQPASRNPSTGTQVGRLGVLARGSC